MPYITQESREKIDYEIDALIAALGRRGWKEGELNYSLYRILLAWFENEPRYHTICSIMGTLTCVAQEFYRKVAGPYEQTAEKKNGPVT